MKNTQVSLIQMDIKFGKKEKNLKNAAKLLEKAVHQAKEGIPHIVCFPELFSTGYDLENVQKHAEKIPQDNTSLYLKQLATEFSTSIIASFMERSEKNFYNTAVIFSEKGEFKGKYRKIHLFPLYPMDERPVFSIGSFQQTKTYFEMNFGKIGLLICFDLRFPELSRRIVLEGAEILIYLAEFPSPRSDIWKRLLQARSIENQIFVCGVNRVGLDPTKTEFFGQSMVFDPDGKILIEGTDKEEVLTVQLDPERLIESRNLINSLESRQPKFY